MGAQGYPTLGNLQTPLPRDTESRFRALALVLVEYDAMLVFLS